MGARRGGNTVGPLNRQSPPSKRPQNRCHRKNRRNRHIGPDQRSLPSFASVKALPTSVWPHRRRICSNFSMQRQAIFTQHIRQIGVELRDKLEPIQRLVDAAHDREQNYPLVRQVLDDCLVQLAQLNFWGAENRVPSSELWNTAGPMSARGWLQNRARTKPRGYAGDHEMLARIYDQQLCDDPLGRLFDRYFQEQAAPVAVRNRMRMMSDWIVETARWGRGTAGTAGRPPEANRPLHVAVFGSAFGLEIRDALLRLEPSARDGLRVTLLDLDPAAIEFAKQRLMPLLRVDQIVATAANLFRLSDRPQIAGIIHQADLLFCPGLFDYLDDTAAAAMLRALAAQLSPGGRLIVYQFAPHNPTRAYMEWIANWYLIYRDAQQLQSVVAAAGLAGHRTPVGAEPLGVALYVTIGG